jgi:hypothetical protein
VVGAIRQVALAAGFVLAFAAPASAAGWLEPVNLSPAGTTSAYGSSIASDTAGESFATWNDTDGTNQRIMLASHVPGSPWTARSPLSDPGRDAGTAPAMSLSSNGFGAIAWVRSDGAKTRVEVSRRVPGGAFGAPDIISAPGIDTNQTAVGVDRAGNVQVAWIDANNAAHTRRFSPLTGWDAAITDLSAAPATPANQILWFLTLVVSPSGKATVAWVFDTNPAGTGAGTANLQVQSRTQDDAGGWLPVVTHTTTVDPTQSGRPQLAVADDGTVTLVWFEYITTSCGIFCSKITTGIVRSQTRSGTTNTWSPAQTLSDPALVSDNPTVAVTPAGETTVAWTEAAANAVKTLTRTVGGAFPVASAATIITPQDRAITSGNLFGIPLTSLHLTATASGTVATFSRTDGTNIIANAVFRPGGGLWPNPTLTPPAALSAPGGDAGFDGLTAGIDGQGNIVTSWTRDGVIQTSTYDVARPAFTDVTVPASATTGQPVAMSSATSDSWGALAAGQPSWSFGDGTAGTGLSVTHAFSAPGTYTVTVGASDTAGNAATAVTRQIVIANAPVPPLPATTVAKPKAKITWRSGKLASSTLTVTGTVGAPASLTISLVLRKTKKTALKSTFAAKAGAWSRTLKLPATLAPGAYDVKVTGPVVQSSQTSFTLAAPASGIVKRTYASGPRRGPSVTTLAHTNELWAHFQFGFLPKKGQKITTQWILPNGRKLAANTRPRTGLVEAQVKDLSGKTLPTGRWRCVIKVGKTVLTTLNVRLS